MKLSSNIITALCLAQSSTAFNVKPSARTFRTIHFSTPFESANIAGARTTLGKDTVSNVSSGSKQAWTEAFDALEDVRVQGGALKTWSYSDPTVERVYLTMTTEGPMEGNPLQCTLELNQGPDNCPQKLQIYSEKGDARPYKMWIETPGDSCAVFIRNTSPVEFPIIAGVGSETPETAVNGILPIADEIYAMSPEQLVQGSAVRSWDLAHEVTSAKIMLKTDGRPLNAQIEMIQGPNAPKYTVDVYTEDGNMRPLTCVFETPGAGNVIRVINKGSLEFPITASVGPTSIIP